MLPLPLQPGKRWSSLPYVDGARVRAIVPAMLLRTWVPDLDAEIVRPARMSQATEAAIMALAGGLTDLHTVAEGARVGR